MVDGIPLIAPEEVKVGRGRTKGEKYGKYAQAIAPHVQWLLDRIKEAPEGPDKKKRIMMKYTDIKKVLGSYFEKLSDKAIYWGLKFVLFHEGIWVEQGKMKDNTPLLVMRMATETDHLPPSLTAGLEPPEEEMPEPGSED